LKLESFVDLRVVGGYRVRKLSHHRSADPSDRSEDYNIRVSTPVPPKLAPEGKHPDNRHQHHHATYAAEATGLLLMAVLLLILTIIRYWRYIPWGAR
jgi:hypothetical protein